MELAYKIARENFVEGGSNRVILCTDGDFNVGKTSDGDLVDTAIAKAKTGVFLSVMGFGTGNLNDSMLEKISNKGNGTYAYIDGLKEAQRVLTQEATGTLFTIAKDVKIQVEFNPAKVANYRLVGYENRVLANEDFNDDKKDAGEIGAGHTVTALYEIVPVGVQSGVETASVDALKYQQRDVRVVESDELLTVKIRYKEPDGHASQLLAVPFVDPGKSLQSCSDDFILASSVASFGMLLRGSENQGMTSPAMLRELVQGISNKALHEDRDEFLALIDRFDGIQTQLASR